MKNFFAEFKKFITRGNVVDMAVGVIVGGAFTAIVNGMGNFILKPLINWLLSLILKTDSLSDIVTILVPSYATDDTGAEILDEAGNKIIDLATSIYIDWGSFINAVLNFFIVAFILFCIVRLINHIRDNQKDLLNKVRKSKPTKEERKAMKADGVKLRNKAAVEAWYAAKAEREAAEAAAAAAAAEEQARLDRLANPTTEDLLKEILAELRKD